MSEIASLAPEAVWKNFDLVCSIPHPSGYEAKLADALKTWAEQHDLSCRSDAAGNLRIDRAASPGYENCPCVIFQAHLDMVPVAEDPDFDFTVSPITPFVDGGVVRARGTTLGGDDGIGVALAMALLSDPELKCGRLSALFTVSEEIGLVGAAALAPDMLEGKYLINLDCGPLGCATIGCAGGARQEFLLPVETEAVSAGSAALKITLSGLPGGHSGECINKNRGNAIKSLAAFLLEQCNLRLSSFDAGNADNAIPHEAQAVVIFSGDIAALKSAAGIFAALLGGEIHCPAVKIEITPAPLPSTQYTETFHRKILTALALAPNEVFEKDDNLNIVRTSSNLAAVFSGGNQLRIRSSQRSLNDAAREMASAMLAEHFAAFGGTSEVMNPYPGWTPQQDSLLVRRCSELWQDMTGNALKLSAIHAGLECGLFGEKNPGLELISLGPGTPGCHTVDEHVDIKCVETLYYFLQKLAVVLAK